MPSPRRLSLAAAVLALAVSWLLPATALGAGTITVSGSVTRGGAPAGGVTVVVEVAGSDMVVPTTTAADGTWTVQVGAAIGDTLTVRAAAPTEAGSPDAKGCILATTATGRASVTIEALPVPAIDVVLDTTVSSTTCPATPTPATPTPAPTAAPTAAPTLPATDASGSGPGPGSGFGALLTCLGLVTVAAGVAAGGRRRAPARR